MSNKLELRKTFFGLPEHFQPIKFLGSGSYGTVASFTVGRGGTSIAVKKIQDVFVDPLITRRTLREVKLMRHFSHENIVKLYDVLSMSTGCKDLYMLTELLDYDLDLLFRQLRETKPMSVDLALSLSFQLLNGCRWMHSAGVIHRDLKPGNIFVTKPSSTSPVLKIGDLGLARGLDDSRDEVGHNPLTEYVVTRWYRPPEVIMFDESYGYGTPMDCWSAACIIYEMFQLYPLFPGKNSMDQMVKITTVVGFPRAHRNVKRPEERAFLRHLTAQHSSSMVPPPKEQFELLLRRLPQFTKNKRVASQLLQYMDLLMKLLKYEPNARISCADAMKHAVFQDYREKIDRCEPSMMDFVYDKAFGSNEYANEVEKQHVMKKLRRAMLVEMNDRRDQFQLIDNVDAPASPSTPQARPLVSPVASCPKSSPKGRSARTPIQRLSMFSNDRWKKSKVVAARDKFSYAKSGEMRSSAKDELNTSQELAQPSHTSDSGSTTDTTASENSSPKSSFTVEESIRSWSALSGLYQRSSPTSTASSRSAVVQSHEPDAKTLASGRPSSEISSPSQARRSESTLEADSRPVTAETRQVATTNGPPTWSRTSGGIPTMARRSPADAGRTRVDKPPGAPTLVNRAMGARQTLALLRKDMRQLCGAAKSQPLYDHPSVNREQRASEDQRRLHCDVHRRTTDQLGLSRDRQRGSVDHLRLNRDRQRGSVDHLRLSRDPQRASVDHLRLSRELGSSDPFCLSHEQNLHGDHALKHAGRKEGPPVKYNPNDRMSGEKRLISSIEQLDNFHKSNRQNSATVEPSNRLNSSLESDAYERANALARSRKIMADCDVIRARVLPPPVQSSSLARSPLFFHVDKGGRGETPTDNPPKLASGCVGFT